MKNTFLPAILFVALIISSPSCENICSGKCCSSDGESFSCLLSDSDLEKRKSDIQKGIFAKITRKEELKNGYRLYFDYDSGTLKSVKEFMEFEKKCCPFFEFDLTEKTDNEEIILLIKVPDGAKDFLKKTVEEFSLLIGKS